MNLDGLLIKKVVLEGTVRPLLEAGVKPEMLKDEGEMGLKTIYEFFQEYGKVPSWDTMKELVPGLMSVDGEDPEGLLEEPVEYFVDEVLERHRKNLIRECLKETSKAWEKEESWELVRRMSDRIVEVRKVDRSESSVVNSTDPRRIEKVKEEYRKLAEGKGEPDGLPTPWDALTRHTMGIHPGELWFLVGRLKSGKTWSAVLFGVTVWKSGNPVLFISMEMRPEQIEKRFHAVAVGLPWNDLRKGTLNPEVEKAYFDFLDGLVDKPKFVIVGSDKVRRPSDVELLVREMKPSLVILDGLYFLKGRGEAGWEKLNDAVTEIQRMAQKCAVPVVATTQFNRKVEEEDTEAGAAEVGYAYGIPQAADVLLTITRTPEDRELGQMRVSLVESRNTTRMSILANWNLTRQNFSMIQVLEGGEEEGFASRGSEAAVDF